MSEIKASKKVSNIREDIKGLTLVEVNELIEGVKEDFQIKEEALIQTTAAAPASEKPQEKTGNVSVRIVKMDEGKMGLNMIKLFRVVKEAISEERKRKGEEGEITIVQAKDIVKGDDKIIL